MVQMRIVSALLASFSLVSIEAGKSISKRPGSKVDKAKLQMMQIYVPARLANGTSLADPLSEDGKLTCQVGVLSEGLDSCVVHPLVSVYMEEETVDGNTGYDIHAAFSLDEGGTWIRKNLSKKGPKLQNYNGRKCFTNEGEEDADSGHRELHEDDGDDGQIAFEYLVNAYKPMLVVKNDRALVAWTSKDCKGDNRTLANDSDDKYMVDGSQFCHDYTGEVEGLEKVPFSCVWTARGIIENGDMIWTKGEMLTSGRRDAFQLFAAVSGDGKAWGLVWQEDPKGLRPGESAGPGEGMSGATVSHKTDVWFSGLGGDDFKLREEGETSSSERPEAVVRFSSPVRVTDNASCKYDPINDVVKGARYCQEICDTDGYSDSLDENGYATCFKDGYPLNGKTGASRPTMVILPTKDLINLGITKPGWQVLIGYEESKGMGLVGDKGAEREDWGKNAFFHSFPFDSPDEVKHGAQLNLPELDELGEPVLTENGTLVHNNARRVRIIAQPTKNMGKEGLAGYLIWREGKEGHGKAAHIMGRRLLDGHLPGNLECKEYKEVVDYSGPRRVCTRGVTDINEGQLPEVEGDLTDARAHRGFLRGDFLAVLYTFTGKWGRSEGKPYDVYLRRSFNGGKKWTSLATGEEEEAKNLSNLRQNETDGNSGWSAMEPRLVPTPGSIGGTAPLTPSDVQNDMVFYVAFCTTHNPHAGDEGRLLEEVPTEHDVAKDIFFTWTDNYGESFKKVYNENVGKWQYPWIAKTSGSALPDDPDESYGAPQLKVTPGGDKVFASYEGNVLPMPSPDDALPTSDGAGAGPCNGGSNTGSEVCMNVTWHNPFHSYDADADGAITAWDLDAWHECCTEDDIEVGGTYDCNNVICDLNGDGEITGHDKKLLKMGISKWFDAHPAPARRRFFLRGRK